MRKNIVLIGGGGHCKSCIDVIHATNQYNIIGILDIPSELGKKILDYEIIGNDEDYLKYHEQGCVFLITVGQIKSTVIRKRIFKTLNAINAYIETIIAPTAYVSENATIEKGTVVMHNAFINAGATIGLNNIINTGAVIEHDVSIGNNNHISTGARINGDCRIGNENFIGSGTVIANGVELQDEIIIGAGSVVVKNINDKGTYVGSPAELKY